MSQANADVVRQQYRALERDLDAVSAFWHPEIEWRAIEGAADDVGVMKGHNALRRYYEDWVSSFDQLRAEVDEVLFDADDQVAVSVRNSGRGREYDTRDQALDAVGPRE
jgi:ketosteroid isomerase-like protein